nr:MAG TPA: hypothetical protein [Caudoviricetes sp.]
MIKEKERKDDLMILEFTNGDIEKFDKVMKKYNFVDAQALIRFAVSILLVNEAKEVMIKQEGSFIPVVPVETIREGVHSNGQQ